MPGSVLTIIKGNDIISTVADPEHIESALMSERPDRFIVEESSMAGELLPSGYTCQRWGVVIKDQSGANEIEMQPAPGSLPRTTPKVK
jgi:hypothetical protein